MRTLILLSLMLVPAATLQATEKLKKVPCYVFFDAGAPEQTIVIETGDQNEAIRLFSALSAEKSMDTRSVVGRQVMIYRPSKALKEKSKS